MAAGTGESDAMNLDYNPDVRLLVQLTRIEEKLNSSNAQFGNWTASSTKVHADLEDRIRKVERVLWALPVTFIASVVSAIGAVVAAVITAKGGL